MWNGVIIADSDATVVVEGNHYFPRQSVKMEFLKPSEKHTVCSWKGTASYFSLEVEGKINQDAAWFYADPSPAAENIRGRIAFWKGVQIV